MSLINVFSHNYVEYLFVFSVYIVVAYNLTTFKFV